jgi:hypothetical protein
LGGGTESQIKEGIIMNQLRFMFLPIAGMAVAVCVSATLHAQQAVDNETVSIIDFFPSFPGYDVDNVLDTGDDRFLSDYASQGGGVDTFIEFDLGDVYPLTEIVMTDRVTSGGGNFTWVGGLFDYNRVFMYTLSVDRNFSNGDGVVDDLILEVEAEEPELGPVLEEDLALLQTSVTFPTFAARYIRWELIDTAGVNPGANDFQFNFGAGLAGDFDGSGAIDAVDIDLLSAEVRNGTNNSTFDANFDGVVNNADRDEWVNVLANTYLGDSNLDGEFNSGDFVLVFGAGQYEDAITGNSTWATGDWNGDTEFNSGDFVAAFAAGGYEQGPRGAVAAVPEPATAMLLAPALLCLAAIRRRR